MWGKISHFEYIMNATHDREKLQKIEEKLSIVTQKNIDLEGIYSQAQVELSLI